MSLTFSFSFFFLVIYFLSTANAGRGRRHRRTYRQPDLDCSDYGCVCEARAACEPDFATNHPCQTESEWGCLGPAILTSFHVSLSTSIVESMLADGLELAEYRDWDDEDNWPVQILLAQQHNINTGFSAQLSHYLEMIVLVNYVQWNDEEAPNYAYRGPFAYAPKLYVDSYPALYGGQYCGTNKEIANGTQVCDYNGNCHFTLFNPNDPTDLILEGEWSPKIPSRRSWRGRSSRRRRNTNRYYPANEIDDFIDIHGGNYLLPYVYQYPVNTGVFQCGYTNWFTEDSLIQPVTGSLTTYRSIIGDLMPDSYDFDESIIDDPQFGAYRIETMWIFEFQCNPNQESCTSFVPTK